ncbi:MAG: hypothetical protein RMJ88_15600 [Thermogemmata sp.]|nr:hypothetical protein [Thermogemmata sp.]
MSNQASIRLKGNFFADPEFFRTDVTKGVTRTPTGTRICTLPPEFLIGLRDALIYECGKSYRQIMKVAGRHWGVQFAKRLERELTTFYQTPFCQLPVGIIRTCLGEAFRAHGYGALTLTPLIDSEEFILAEVRDPLLPSLVGESDRPVDLLMAGMLGAVMSHLSGRTLDAVQSDCPTMGADRSRFIIGPAADIADVEKWIDEEPQMPTHDSIVSRITRRFQSRAVKAASS